MNCTRLFFLDQTDMDLVWDVYVVPTKCGDSGKCESYRFNIKCTTFKWGKGAGSPMYVSQFLKTNTSSQKKKKKKKKKKKVKEYIQIGRIR